MSRANPIADLSLHGRQIKHHLSAADKHKDKFHQHRQAAALMLIEAKTELPHGKWYPWLQEHGINPRTAQVLIQEHSDPAAEAKRKEYDAQRKAEERREQNRRTPADFTPPPQSRRPDPEPSTPRQPRAEPAEVKRLGHVRLRRLIDQLTDEQVRRVEGFINQIQGE